MYLLLIDYGQDGWSIDEYKSIEELLTAIQGGETNGQRFRIAKGLDLSCVNAE